MNPINKLMAGVLLAIALASGGFIAGSKNSDRAWQAKAAVQAKKDLAAFAAEAARSDKAATDFALEARQLTHNFDQLTEQFNDLRNRGPLLVYRPAGVPGPGLSNRGAVGAGDVLAPLPGAPTDAANIAGIFADAQGPTGAVGSDGAGFKHHRAGTGGDAFFTAGAVWLWNSALAGRDTPTGACGAVDTAATACAVDSGISLSDALTNHAANAKSCALDRLRHERLIDYLTGQKTEQKTGANDGD